jgi:hypothetical protein
MMQLENAGADSPAHRTPRLRFARMAQFAKTGVEAPEQRTPIPAPRVEYSKGTAPMTLMLQFVNVPQESP